MEERRPVLLEVRSHPVCHVVRKEGPSSGRELPGELRGEGQVGVVEESCQPVLGQEREVGIN